jgi:hypothetical protein
MPTASQTMCAPKYKKIARRNPSFLLQASESQSRDEVSEAIRQSCL